MFSVLIDFDLAGLNQFNYLAVYAWLYYLKNKIIYFLSR